ncbi:MAG: DNA polymerase IV [Eubacteriales bacterium]|nr:DNA polymerase IV [Eubacteriales bacterium]
MSKPCILHCDMNSYYASVATMLNPKLKGKPVAVAGSREDRHGIILAKSQEAKICGVKTGEIIAEAQAKCPDLILVPPQYEAYVYYSRLSREIYYRYTDQVESFGLDECWLDVTASKKLFGSGPQIADELRAVMRQELGLTISVGVSYNKVFAKLGSDLKKPDATNIIREDDLEKLVWQLPVESLLGVGPATRTKLSRFGVRTIGQLAKLPPSWLQAKFGVNGYKLWRWANGLDDGKVRHWGEPIPVKSIGHSLTLRQDLYLNTELKSLFLDLSQEVARRLRLAEFKAGGLQISLKSANFNYQEWQTPLPYPSQSSVYLAKAAYQLAKEKYDFKEPLRAIGIRAISLIPQEQPLQLNFFSDAAELERLEHLDDAIYDLRARYGADCLTWGSLLGEQKTAEPTPWEICPPGLPS